MSRTRTSFTAWVKGMHQAWSRHIIIVSVVAVAFGMLQKPLLALLSFIESLCLAHLSPNWFGAFVVFLVGYLLKREWVYRKIYVPRPVSLWLILLLGIYLYYRHWEGSFSFWTIPYFGRLAWSDLLLFPWGGAVAIALRSRSKEDRFFLGLVLLLLCAVLYFVPQAQGCSLLGWPLINISITLVSCLLGYLILHRWGYRLQPVRKKAALSMSEISSQPVDTDDAIVSKDEDWLGFSDQVSILESNLYELDLTKSSLTVGVIAPWGRGKSSFVNLLKERLEKDRGIIITFNPRGSKLVSSIQEDFFDVFAKELSRHYLGFALLLARYTKHLGLLNQYAWTRPLGSLLTLLLPGKEQEAVNRTLRELGRRVYVVIDDLDRLSGEEVLEVLKLIDRNASFSNTVFITAYDKVYINNVLRMHLDHGLNHCFVDKYISWEIPLLEPDKERLKQLMWVILLRRIRSCNLALQDNIEKGWNKVADVVVESVTSVRDFKRYLNLMVPRYYEVIEWVDCKDYFLLYLLCYKDLDVYISLYSGRLLQLDTTTMTYVLSPNFEGELRMVSCWEFSKRILERLFPSGVDEEEVREFSYSSLRNRHTFDTYFKADKAKGESRYADAISRIACCWNEEDPYGYIDLMIEELGIDRVLNIFLYLVKSPCYGMEHRNITIKLMAYVAFRDGLLRESRILQEELCRLFSLERYEHYKELGVVKYLFEYKKILEPVLAFLIQEQPLWMSDLIDRFALKQGISSHVCLYSIAEISTILLECQKSYYSLVKLNDSCWKHIRGFVFKEYMNSYSRYIGEAVRRLIPLIRENPEVCMWLVLSREDLRSSGVKFELAFDEELLQLLARQNLTLVEWRALLRDSQLKVIVDYVRNYPGRYTHVELLSDEEINLDSIDYVYRAILAHKKKKEERKKQAMFKG